MSNPAESAAPNRDGHEDRIKKLETLATSIRVAVTVITAVIVGLGAVAFFAKDVIIEVVAQKAADKSKPGIDEKVDGVIHPKKAEMEAVVKAATGSKDQAAAAVEDLKALLGQWRKHGVVFKQDKLMASEGQVLHVSKGAGGRFTVHLWFNRQGGISRVYDVVVTARSPHHGGCEITQTPPAGQEKVFTGPKDFRVQFFTVPVSEQGGGFILKCHVSCEQAPADDREMRFTLVGNEV